MVRNVGFKLKALKLWFFSLILNQCHSMIKHKYIEKFPCVCYSLVSQGSCHYKVYYYQYYHKRLYIETCKSKCYKVPKYE